MISVYGFLSIHTRYTDVKINEAFSPETKPLITVHIGNVNNLQIVTNDAKPFSNKI